MTCDFVRSRFGILHGINLLCSIGVILSAAFTDCMQPIRDPTNPILPAIANNFVSIGASSVSICASLIAMLVFGLNLHKNMEKLAPHLLQGFLHGAVAFSIVAGLCMVARCLENAIKQEFVGDPYKFIAPLVAVVAASITLILNIVLLLMHGNKNTEGQHKGITFVGDSQVHAQDTVVFTKLKQDNEQTEDSDDTLTFVDPTAPVMKCKQTSV